MTHHRSAARPLSVPVFAPVFVTALLALAGCSSSGSNPGTGASIAVTLSPAHGPVLTCSTQAMQATVTGSSNQVVGWTVTEDASHGTIDPLSGLFTAPIAMPTPSTATVVATALADSKTQGTALLTLGTAFPSAARPITGSAGSSTFDTGTFVHSVAARGNRVYAVWPDNSNGATSVSLMVARSDDGGATWTAPVAALTANLQAPNVVPNSFVRCPAVAIDAGSPDVVYAIGDVAGPTDVGMLEQPLNGNQTQLIATSTDGGATWTQRTLHVAAGGDICADVTSPAPNTVTVVSPGWGGCVPGVGGSRDMFVWSDASRGAGFATGTILDSPAEYFSDGYTHGLDNLDDDVQCTDAHLWPEGDGGTDAAGDATESPRVLTDGAGNVCVSYIGNINHASGVMEVHAYIQCSADAGTTWTAPVVLDGASPPQYSTSAVAAAGPNGVVTALWSSGRAGGLYTATSTDGGRTFAPPSQTPHPILLSGDSERSIGLNPMIAYDAQGILWVAYRAYDGTVDQLIVDKSCDGGQTWSGPRSIDTAGVAMKFPTFALTPGAAPTLAAWADDHLATFTLTPPAQ
jgi:hypothetical protein